jgi:predicted ATPase
LSFPAVELFSERATAALGGLGLADADIPAALEICRHLDGVPLAIVLAAAQVDVFSVRGLAARLDDRFAVLTKGVARRCRSNKLCALRSIGAMN